MKRTLMVTVLLFLAGAVAASAQDVPTVWDSPTFMGPRPGSDIGIYIIDSDIAEPGLQGIWRTSGGTNLGLRLGFLDAPGDEVVTLGVETWGDIVVQDADFPLDLSWTTGVGAAINGNTVFGIPLGVSIGRTLDIEDSDVSIQVYGHPRLGLTIYDDPITDDLETDLSAMFDLGADVYLGSGLAVEVSASLGDYDAVGIGLAWRQ